MLPHCPNVRAGLGVHLERLFKRQHHIQRSIEAVVIDLVGCHAQQIRQRHFPIPLFGDVKFAGKIEQPRHDEDVRAVDGVPDAKPHGFVGLPKPRYNPLPWPSPGSIRLDERPLRCSLSVFFFEVLSDKHGGDLMPQFRARQISSSHYIAFQFSKHGRFRFSDLKTRQTFFGRSHFVTLLGKLD